MNKQHPLYKDDIAKILSIKDIETLNGKTLLITGATGMMGMTGQCPYHRSRT